METLDSNKLADSSVREAIPAPPVAASAPQRGKVAVGFVYSSSNAVLIVVVAQILKAMTGNAQFTAPLPALADVQAALTAFADDVNAAHAGKLAVAARRQKRAALVALVRSLALYVQQAGRGDRVVLLGSGFPLQRARQAAGLPAAPTGLRLARGAVGGQLRARCTPVAMAGAYQWRYATAAAPTAWTWADPTLGSRVTLTGLLTGTQYVVQVRAIGARGAGDWCDAGVLMVA